MTMLISIGIATSLIASSLVGDTSVTSWKHYTRPSFSHRHSRFWPEAMPQMSGSLRRTSVTLYNQTNITSFITTTLLSASAASDPYQIYPTLGPSTTTTPPITMSYTTTTVLSPQPSTALEAMSNPEDPNTPSDAMIFHGDDQSMPSVHPFTTRAVPLDDASLSGYQNLLISVIIDFRPPSLFATEIPDGTPPQGAHIHSLHLPSEHNTRSSRGESAKVQTSDIRESSSYVTKSWNILSTSATTEPSSTLAPPYPLNPFTAFPLVRSDTAPGLPNSASTFATSMYPSLPS